MAQRACVNKEIDANFNESVENMYGHKSANKDYLQKDYLFRQKGGGQSADMFNYFILLDII